MLLIIFIVAIGISIAFRLIFKLRRTICFAIGWRFFCVICSIVLCTFCVIIISIGCFLFTIAALIAICLDTHKDRMVKFKNAENVIFARFFLTFSSFVFDDRDSLRARFTGVFGFSSLSKTYSFGSSPPSVIAYLSNEKRKIP